MNVMTTKNDPRDGWGLSIAKFCLGLIGVGGLYVVGASFAQQPPVTGGLSLPTPPATDAAPTETLKPIPSEDHKNDPLFQEIQRMILGGGSPLNLNSFDTAPLQQKAAANIDSISVSRWHAVESILRAARNLEKDVRGCIQRSDLDGASKLQVSIKNLRTQAMELLH